MNDSVQDKVVSLLSELEPITPKLCKELTKKGFKQQDLDTLKSDGYQFNRKRNSFILAS